MRKPRILIADDDRAFLNLLRVRFHALGCDVIVAANGQDALVLACDESPNVIILDINMPGTGFMVHRCKRQIGSLRLKPVIYVTGAGDGPISLAKKLGAYAVLKKPVDFGKLAETVQAALEMDGHVLGHVVIPTPRHKHDCDRFREFQEEVSEADNGISID